MNSPRSTDGLGRAMASGGAVMLARQAVGALIGVATISVIMTLIGPAEYGRYASVQALVLVGIALVPNGIAAALIRRQTEPEQEEWSAAAMILLIAGCCAPFALAGLAALLGACTDTPGLALLALVTAAAMPLSWPAQVATARLERDLDYRRIAVGELAGQATFACAAAVLAWFGWGAWAAAAAFAAQQVVWSLCVRHAAKGLPGPRWLPRPARPLLRYAGGWAISSGTWQLRHLVNPIVVGSCLGSAAVGQVAFAMRAIETLAAAKGIASRVGPAGLARVRTDLARMRQLVGQGMELGVLAVGVPVAAAAAGMLWFGHLMPVDWTGVAQVLPGLVIAAIAGSLAVLWTSVLLLEGRLLTVSCFHLVHAALLAGTACLLVPRWGLTGYALSEIVAVVGYVIPYAMARRLIGPFTVAHSTGNALLLACAPIAVWTAPWIAAFSCVPLLRPSSWRHLGQLRQARPHV